MSNKHIAKFLELKCSGDVLNATTPIIKTYKEITETMAIMKHIKKIVVMSPEKYQLVDLCAGNALTSVLAAHLFNGLKCIAVDKRVRKRRFELVNNFEYINHNIFEDDFCSKTLPSILDKDRKTVIISVHPCSTLAIRTIEIFNEISAEYIVIMPCCHKNMNGQDRFIAKKLGKYGQWCLHLRDKLKYEYKINVKMHEDKFVISPKNIVLIGKRCLV